MRDWTLASAFRCRHRLAILDPLGLPADTYDVREPSWVDDLLNTLRHDFNLQLRDS